MPYCTHRTIQYRTNIPNFNVHNRTHCVLRRCVRSCCPWLHFSPQPHPLSPIRIEHTPEHLTTHMHNVIAFYLLRWWAFQGVAGRRIWSSDFPGRSTELAFVLHTKLDAPLNQHDLRDGRFQFAPVARVCAHTDKLRLGQQKRAGFGLGGPVCGCAVQYAPLRKCVLIVVMSRWQWMNDDE